MESSAYKRLQAAWVSSNAGSTMEEPWLVLLPLPLMVYFVGALQPRLSGFIYEFILVILPITLNLTALSYHLHILPTIIGLALVLFFLRKGTKSGVSLSRVLSSSPGNSPEWITNFRACVNLVSIICILAVDLNIFPRKFAKTETYGFGVMDIGVGLYVVCNGLVHRAFKRLKPELFDVGILTILGAIRLVSTRMVDYQEHVSEYGVHWNFFFTLAVCRLATAIITRSLQISFFWLAVTTGVVHHFILTSGVQDWVLSSTARVTFLEANREGIASALGYVTLFYASAAFSKFVSGDSLRKLIVKTTVVTIGAWVATHYCVATVGISRRLCNTGYIAWTLAMAGSLILPLLVADVAMRCTGGLRTSSLLSAINRNGLFFFLLGNILTGVINMNIQTLLLSSVESYGLLFGHIFTVTSVTYNLRDITI